jgi:hypothetical protein
MTPGQRTRIDFAKQLADEAAGTLDCLHTFAEARDGGDPIADALGAVRRLTRMCSDELDAIDKEDRL